MKNNTDKKTFKLGIIAIAVCVIIFLWFSFRPGLMGTLHWHQGINFAYIMLLVIALFPAIFFVINLLKTNKATTILSRVFSIFSMSFWIITYIALMILPRLPLDNSGLTIAPLSLATIMLPIAVSLSGIISTLISCSLSISNSC